MWSVFGKPKLIDLFLEYNYKAAKEPYILVQKLQKHYGLNGNRETVELKECC